MFEQLQWRFGRTVSFCSHSMHRVPTVKRKKKQEVHGSLRSAWQPVRITLILHRSSLRQVLWMTSKGHILKTSRSSLPYPTLICSITSIPLVPHIEGEAFCKTSFGKSTESPPKWLWMLLPPSPKFQFVSPKAKRFRHFSSAWLDQQSSWTRNPSVVCRPWDRLSLKLLHGYLSNFSCCFPCAIWPDIFLNFWNKKCLGDIYTSKFRFCSHWDPMGAKLSKRYCSY